jgi:hypothetical protein
MESQLALVKDIFSGLIKFMKEDLSHMADDRTRREIELMNVLAKVDDEKRVMGMEMEKKVQEKEDLLDQVREEYEELGLEYDENEVKRALEVRYLLEQMEKVKEDKVRLEKELFAALLEREEQINRLKLENVSLEEKLDGLKREEVEKGRGENVLLTDTLAPSGEVGESSSVDRCDDDLGIQKESKDVHVDDDPVEKVQAVNVESCGGDEDVTTVQEDTVDVRSDVTTQSDSATLVEDGTVPVAADSNQAEEGENDVGINDANHDPAIVTQSSGEEGAGASAGAESTQKDVSDDNAAAAATTDDNEINDEQIQPESDQLHNERAGDGLSEVNSK